MDDATVNELIREALHPYPEGLHIATKVGARRDPDKSWPMALSRQELITAVHENLGLDALDLVNLRVGGVFETTPGSIAEPFTVVAELLAVSSVRQCHAVLISALSAAKRWGWITVNPLDAAQRPRMPAPQPDPPSAEGAAKIATAAWGQDAEWGTFVWLTLLPAR